MSSLSILVYSTSAPDRCSLSSPQPPSEKVTSGASASMDRLFKTLGFLVSVSGTVIIRNVNSESRHQRPLILATIALLFLSPFALTNTSLVSDTDGGESSAVAFVCPVDNASAAPDQPTSVAVSDTLEGLKGGASDTESDESDGEGATAGVPVLETWDRPADVRGRAPLPPSAVARPRRCLADCASPGVEIKFLESAFLWLPSRPTVDPDHQAHAPPAAV